MATRNVVGSIDILCLLTVLICVRATTAEEATTSLHVTQDTPQDGFMSNDTTDSFRDVLDDFGDNGTTENVFTEEEIIMTRIMSTTERSTILTSIVVHSTTQHSSTSTQVVSDATTSPISKVNTTLAIPSVENAEIARLKTEAKSLLIAVIVISIVAGLGILCIIILVVWLITQKRKQKNSQSDSWMEITNKESNFPNEKFPTLTRNSSSDGLDSRPGVSAAETNSNRAYAPEESPEVYIETNYPNAGTTSFTPTDTFQYNDDGEYVNYNKDNEYVNESSQKDEIYNNLRDGIYQSPSSSRKDGFNPLPTDSSVDDDVYINFKKA